MFLSLVSSFSIFLSASSLLVMTKNGETTLLLYYASFITNVRAYKLSKGKIFGAAVVAHPSNFINYIRAFIIWPFYYLLVCVAPLFITFVQSRQPQPKISSFLIICYSLANGIMIYVGLPQ